MSAAEPRAHRGTIFVEDARVISHDEYAGEQFILRVRAPECARRAVAGSFAHVRCDRDIPMRRPLSIMRADPTSGEVWFLYKIVGTGLAALSRIEVGDELSILGPIGNGFCPDPARPRKLMIGGGVGIPPMLFLAEQLRAAGQSLAESLVLMGSEVPFPFATRDSTLTLAGIPDGVRTTIPELEFNGIPVRLASLQGYPGCYTGYVTDLAAEWLSSIDPALHDEVELFACGPEPMLAAAARVAERFNLPCQLSLEEFMACAVGGCAGCAVPIHGDGKVSMQRVCVDGPVFPAKAVYPPEAG